ncbi:G-protein coupled receptor Mth2-like isoform X2 [Neodiprion fabricii]|uniref:G-protein coupled receptor Mth2-like isoform X2 n=1 Tax=Neodiprion fabricii TaxID=2872261 RepID=UPI001ED8F5D2|nr:G-protein coupled receptor Mth2-like isoform X2 [Neodiprion fabricii]
MADFEVVLLVLSALSLIVPEPLFADDVHRQCPINARINLTSIEPDVLGLVRKSNHVFPPASIWHQDGNIFGCICHIKPCLPICCPLGMSTVKGSCVKSNASMTTNFTLGYIPDDQLSPVELTEENFHMIVSDPCNGGDAYILEPEESDEDIFHLMRNGSIHLPFNNVSRIITFDDYCLNFDYDSSTFMPKMCYEPMPEVLIMRPLFNSGIMIISVPFFIATFLAYTILPETMTIHGLSIATYVACLTVAYVTVSLNNIIGPTSDSLCQFSSFVIHFSFLASFFWLNVMCVDIWWTFAGYRSIQGSVRQRERKKFILYSIYAWGCACLLTGICIIMEYAPGIPSNIVRPEFGVDKCWFKTEMAKAYYFYIPMGLTVLCNIILFILTAAKIIQHKKNTAHQLKGTESRRHDDNKQWFNLYLKLFIVMGINWSMEIISWAYKSPEYLWYITDLANTLQGVIIFIIFVWKEKIKRLLMKRFGCKGENFLSRDSTRSAYHSSTSRTCTTSVPLNEKTNSCPEPAAKYKSTNFDDSDGA